MSHLMQPETPTKGCNLGAAQPWIEVAQNLEKSFVRDFDSSSSAANLYAIRNIRNFTTASSMNKNLILGSDLIRGRLMSLTNAFTISTNHSTTFKREILGLYASFLRDKIPSFTEELLQETGFLKNILWIVFSAEPEEAPIQEAIALFLKALFGGDDLDQDLESATSTRKQIALDLFTEDHISMLRISCEALINKIKVLSSKASSSKMAAILKSTLVSLVKLISQLATDPELARRLCANEGLQFAHRRVMATLCSRHTSVTQQDRDLLLTYEASISSQCPDSFVHTISRFSLKIIFFILFHVPAAFDIFKKVVRENEPLALISIYKHIDQPCFQCLVGPPLSLIRSNEPSFSWLPRKTYSDPVIGSIKSPFRHRPSPLVCGSAVQADHATCVMVSLCRGVLFWRLVNSVSLPCTSAQLTVDKDYVERPPTKLLRLSSPKLSDNDVKECTISGNIRQRTFCVVVASDRFGNKTVTSRGLGILDEDVVLKILQPLTLNILLLNKTRVVTWVCRVLELVLSHTPSLHQYMLYTNIFSPKFDEHVSSLLKPVQSASVNDFRMDSLEPLVPFARLFACLASTREDVRVRVGELFMTKKFIHFFVSHPFISTCSKIICVNFTLAVCHLIHALSRSVEVQFSLFRDPTIINCLIELGHQYLGLPTVDENCLPILIAVTSAVVNLQISHVSTYKKWDHGVVRLFRSLIEIPSPRLALQLNGVWGLACFTHAVCVVMEKEGDIDDAFQNAYLSRSLVGAVLTLAGQILQRLLQTPTESDKQNFGDSCSDVGSTPSLKSTSSLELHFIHQTLLLLRNISTSKMLVLHLNPEVTESIFSVLSTLFASTVGVPVIIKEEALLVLSNMLTNADVRNQFWTQNELVDNLSALIVPTASFQVKSAALLITINLIEMNRPFSSTGGDDSQGELFEHILALLFDDTSLSFYCRSNHRYSKLSRSRSLHHSFSSSIAAARSTLETIDSTDISNGPSNPLAVEPVDGIARRRNDLSGTSTTTSADEPSEAEIRDAKLELFGPSLHDLNLADSGRFLSENIDGPFGWRPLTNEWESSFTGPDSPLLKLLRGLISIILEVHSNQNLRDVWDWQLLRIDRNRRKVFAHRLHPGHRFSLALQFLGGATVSTLKELFSRLASSLGVLEPAILSSNTTANVSLAGILAHSVAMTGTTEMTQYSTSEATSEVEFDDD